MVIADSTTVNFKGTLKDRQSDGPLATQLDSISVPEGEVWEVTNLIGYDSVQSELVFIHWDGTNEFNIKNEPNTHYIDWVGSVWLEEGENIRLDAAVAGNLILDVLGKRLYA